MFETGCDSRGNGLKKGRSRTKEDSEGRVGSVGPSTGRTEGELTSGRRMGKKRENCRLKVLTRRNLDETWLGIFLERGFAGWQACKGAGNRLQTPARHRGSAGFGSPCGACTGPESLQTGQRLGT